jgi:hypothetical protein
MIPTPDVWFFIKLGFKLLCAGLVLLPFAFLVFCIIALLCWLIYVIFNTWYRGINKAVTPATPEAPKA